MARPNNSRRKRWNVVFYDHIWDNVAQKLVAGDGDLIQHPDGSIRSSNFRDFKTAKRAWTWVEHLVSLGLPYVRVTHATSCMRYVRAEWVLADDRAAQ